MKIVFVTRMLAAYRAPVYERCKALGHDVVIFHFTNTAFSKVRTPDSLSVSSRKYQNWLPSFFERKGYFFNALLAIRAAFESSDLHVLEGESNFLINLLLIPILNWRRKPYVWWSLGALPSKATTWRRRVTAPIVKYMLFSAQRVACYSSFGADFYIQLGANPDKVKVALNSLDPELIYRNLTENKLQAVKLVEQNHWEDRLRIAYIGALEPKKCPQLLFEGAAQYQSKTGMKLGLFIVGEGSELEVCRKLAQELEVDTCFAGHQDLWAASYLLASHMVVLPGLGGLAINHAMMLGRPVLCGPADGTERDLVIDGITGVLLNKVEPICLGEQLAHLNKHRALLAQMGERALEHVNATASMDHLVRTILGLS